jgi:hypothetical protein
MRYLEQKSELDMIGCVLQKPAKRPCDLVGNLFGEKVAAIYAVTLNIFGPCSPEGERSAVIGIP